MKNETPNEKNHRLLKQRFANETNVQIGNETYNADGFEIEPVSENETEMVHQIKIGNEFLTGFENETETETGFENENEEKNETENELDELIGNELVKAMKNEILFYSTSTIFKQSSSPSSKKDYVQIRILNKDNIDSLFERYCDTVNYYLEKEYLLADEVDDFRLAVERLNKIAKDRGEMMQRDLFRNMHSVFDDESDDDDELNGSVDARDDGVDDSSLLQKLYRFFCGE